MNEQIGPWWTTKQLAKHLQLPVSTVRAMIRRNDLKAANFGTEGHPLYRIPASEVRRLDRLAA